jgi:hypothetical protein
VKASPFANGESTLSVGKEVPELTTIRATSGIRVRRIADSGAQGAVAGQNIAATLLPTTTGATRLATVIQQPQGAREPNVLRLVVWEISSDGERISQKATAMGGAVTGQTLDLCRSSPRVVVAASRDSARDLRLTRWGFRFLPDDRVQINQVTGGEDLPVPIDEGPRITSLVSFPSRVVTGSLRGRLLDLQSWSVSTGIQQLFRRRTGRQSVGLDEFALLSQGMDLSSAMFSGRVFTALSDGSFNLRLIALNVSLDGSQFQRVATGTAGQIDDLDTSKAFVRISPRRGIEFVVTAVRDSEGLLKLISWDVSQAGTIRRCDDIRGPRFARVSVASAGEGLLVTAHTDLTRSLKVLVWAVAEDGTFRLVGRRTQRGSFDLPKAIDIGGGRIVTAVSSGRGRRQLRLFVWNLEPTVSPPPVTDPTRGSGRAN